MGQVSYDYTTAKNGTLIGSANAVSSFTNPIAAQVTAATVGGTTDGTYTLLVTDDASGETWAFDGVGSSSTTTQIAAAVEASADADVDFAGVGTVSAAVAVVTITFADAGRSYTVAWSADPSGASTVANTTDAGGSVLPVGLVVYLSSDGEVSPATAGGSGAIVGVVVEGADAEITNGALTPAYGYPPGATCNVLTRGECWVKVADAVTAGGAVDYKGANATAALPLGLPGSASLTDGTAIPSGAAKWKTSAAAFGLARLMVNIP